MAKIKFIENGKDKSKILTAIGEKRGLFVVFFIGSGADYFSIYNSSISFDYFNSFIENSLNNLSPNQIAKKMLDDLHDDYGHMLNTSSYFDRIQSMYIVYVDEKFGAFLGCDDSENLRFIDSVSFKKLTS